MRYLKLWLALARNSFIRQTEFKANFVGRLSIEIVWVLSQAVFYKSAFQFIPDLGGWTEGQMWFFVGSLFFVDGLMMCLFHDNQQNFGQMIRLGQFDFYLLYPASSLFLANLRFVNVISVTNLVLAIGIVGWASTLPDVALGPIDWLIWLVYMGVGAALVGLFGVLICALTFWTTQSSNLVWLFFEVYRLGHRPESIYQPWLRRVLYTVFPAAFFISVPVQLVIGKLDGWWFVYPLAILAAAASVVLWVWRRGVARFEGALS